MSHAGTSVWCVRPAGRCTVLARGGGEERDGGSCETIETFYSHDSSQRYRLTHCRNATLPPAALACHLASGVFQVGLGQQTRGCAGCPLAAFYRRYLLRVSCVYPSHQQVREEDGTSERKTVRPYWWTHALPTNAVESRVLKVRQLHPPWADTPSQRQSSDSRNPP